MPADWCLIISFTLHAGTQFKRKKAQLVAHTELIARKWESAAASGREQLHIDPLWLPNIFAWESAFTTLMTVGRPLSMRFGIALMVLIVAFLTQAVQAITSVVDLQYDAGNTMATMARMLDLLIWCVPARFAAASDGLARNSTDPSSRFASPRLADVVAESSTVMVVRTLLDMAAVNKFLSKEYTALGRRLLSDITELEFLVAVGSAQEQADSDALQRLRKSFTSSDEINKYLAHLKAAVEIVFTRLRMTDGEHLFGVSVTEGVIKSAAFIAVSSLSLVLNIAIMNKSLSSL